MNVNERIKKIREEFCNDSNKEFAIKMDVAPNVVNNYIRNGYSVGDGVLYKIIERFPNINKDWLLTGKGAMLKSNKDEFDSADNTKLFSVPLIPFDAVAGFNGYDNLGIRYEDCEKYTVPEFSRSGVEFVIRVSGSSMYPKYSNGDILACRKITDILFFQWGKTYVIDSSQGVLVKRIYEDEGNPDNIILVSDNKEKYPPHPMPKSDIRSLSIVLGVIRME